MEVGIEDCLHIEFEYDKSKYHLKDTVVGKIYFLLVRPACGDCRLPQAEATFHKTHEKNSLAVSGLERCLPSAGADKAEAHGDRDSAARDDRRRRIRAQ